jgi:DHA2 family multidrug resistance protein
MSHLDTQLSFGSAAFARMLQSVGLPFLFVPITTIAYVGLRPEQSNQASALMNVARNLGGTIGISTVQTMLAQRSQFHQARLVETMSPLNPDYASGLAGTSQALVAQGQPQVDSMRQATALIYRGLGQQAQMLSYVDVFHTLMIVVLGAIPLLLLMQREKVGHEAAMGPFRRTRRGVAFGLYGWAELSSARGECAAGLFRGAVDRADRGDHGRARPVGLVDQFQRSRAEHADRTGAEG